MTDTNDMREAFEREAKKTGRFDLQRNAKCPDDYWHTPTQQAWAGFQLAWQSQQAQGEAAVNPEPWKDGWTEWWEGSDGWTHVKTNVLNRRLRSHPSAPAAVPEGQAIRLLARVQGWWQNTDGDMPASLEQDIAALLTASPAPEHSGDGNEMVVEANLLRQQLEEAERDRDSFADGLLLADFYSECPECGEYIDNGPHHPDCKYTDVIARARSIVDRQHPQGGEDE